MKIDIPPAALEAGARALLLAETPVAMEWNYSISAVREEYLDKARAAFLAMIEAWPGMQTVSEFYTRDGDYFEPSLILPLTEKPDGE